MTANGAPASDLARIVFAAPAHVVTAVPLEPAARIIGMHPSFAAPLCQRLRGVHTEIVELRIALAWAELRAFEPVRRKLTSAVGQVLAAENAQSKHLFGRQFRIELWVKVLSHG